MDHTPCNGKRDPGRCDHIPCHVVELNMAEQLVSVQAVGQCDLEENIHPPNITVNTTVRALLKNSPVHDLPRSVTIHTHLHSI